MAACLALALESILLPRRTTPFREGGGNTRLTEQQVVLPAVAVCDYLDLALHYLPAREQAGFVVVAGGLGLSRLHCRLRRRRLYGRSERPRLCARTNRFREDGKNGVRL